MKKIYYIILIIIIIILAILIYSDLSNQKQQTQFSEESEIVLDNKELELPIKGARERVFKKPFGIRVSPGDSPISPERFSGYHTGTDYEIFKDEKEDDIEIFAICKGKILRKELISGYGGIIVQACELNNQSVTVIYGHININSVKKEIGDNLLIKESIALLGQAFSLDTDNERKHLHLGIHKGDNIDFKGYVQKESELNNWIDFEEYIQNSI